MQSGPEAAWLQTSLWKDVGLFYGPKIAERRTTPPTKRRAAMKMRMRFLRGGFLKSSPIGVFLCGDRVSGFLWVDGVSGLRFVRRFRCTADHM